jgi:hypothetical protein
MNLMMEVIVDKNQEIHFLINDQNDNDFEMFHNNVRFVLEKILFV